MVNIQIKDNDGSWRTVNSTPDHNSINVTARMREAASAYPGRSVRAITDRGSLLDMM